MTNKKEEITEEQEEQLEKQDEVLKALLSAEDKPEKDVYMSRFGVYFKLRAIDGDTISKIQERCTHYQGKGRKKEKILDEEKFSALLIKEACVNPDWSNKKLLEKYKVSDPAEVIRKRLLAGEIVKLGDEILELSGFDAEDEEEGKVKN